MKETKLSRNRTVVISGAAGGLGRVLVRKFASLSYQVIAIDIDKSGLSALSELKNVKTRFLDVTNPEQVRIYAEEFDQEQKALELLICLAGIYDTYPVTEADPVLLQKIIAVNFFGVAFMVNGFIKPLISSKGHVIVVSSESYKIQALFQPYMISKAALEAYCRVARQELALKGVKLTVIRPGAIRTPLLDWMSSRVHSGQYAIYNQEFSASRQRSIEMVGRITSAEKVAGKILQASTVSRPKRIYRINNNPVLTLVSLLPAGIIDRLIVRMFRIKGK
jgi:NAD(P)-dependent dehydrogenase (short-subunit alcohol dehydrogenase family)